MGGCLGTSKKHPPQQATLDQKSEDEAPARPRPTRPTRSRAEAAAAACLPPRSPKHYYRKTDDVTARTNDVTARTDDVTTAAAGVDHGRQNGSNDVTPNGEQSAVEKRPLDRDGAARHSTASSSSSSSHRRHSTASSSRKRRHVPKHARLNPRDGRLSPR
ncbi:hypothetical protein CLOP_g10479 [Closterium sp. NIES-67]|nr:hypothetical protein CLOP_g10479 [Closterium sp. NIES-67]